ncbi:STAS domain-containing protein [Sedimenticola sp.]|uniref:STAS domain-containing protein n=1 Tax=Sedimenticola sp. TaxID=1940285 RepID=UPI00258274B9|nr:STAS domain-containing protein [Sedimenticola sp.]MCW8903443.1 STAS domain-containing protein [Sedimenticola sp.]
MSSVQAAIDDQGVMQLSGDLVFANVTALLGQIERLLGGVNKEPLVIDLSRVGDVDSSGLALLLEVMERARHHGVALRIRSLPEALLGIARLSNVEKLLLPES